MMLTLAKLNIPQTLKFLRVPKNPKQFTRDKTIEMQIQSQQQDFMAQMNTYNSTENPYNKSEVIIQGSQFRDNS